MDGVKPKPQVPALHLNALLKRDAPVQRRISNGTTLHSQTWGETLSSAALSRVTVKRCPEVVGTYGTTLQKGSCLRLRDCGIPGISAPLDLRTSRPGPVQNGEVHASLRRPMTSSDQDEATKSSATERFPTTCNSSSLNLGHSANDILISKKPNCPQQYSARLSSIVRLWTD